jgi:hypothetical protein
MLCCFYFWQCRGLEVRSVRGGIGRRCQASLFIVTRRGRHCGGRQWHGRRCRAMVGRRGSVSYVAGRIWLGAPAGWQPTRTGATHAAVRRRVAGDGTEVVRTYGRWGRFAQKKPKVKEKHRLTLRRNYFINLTLLCGALFIGATYASVAPLLPEPLSQLTWRPRR